MENKGRRRMAVVVPVLAGVGFVFYLVGDALTSRPDLAGFRPECAGRSEAAMWRSYYEGHWVELGMRIVRMAREEYRFSWCDCARMAWHAARAASDFRIQTGSPRCLPHLEAYYRIVGKGAPAGFDAGAAARSELMWWTQRRRGSTPEEYAGTIADGLAQLYGVPSESLFDASLLRAEAMDYRDSRRRSGMSNSDWREIGFRLESAYRLLRHGLGRRECGMKVPDETPGRPCQRSTSLSMPTGDPIQKT